MLLISQFRILEQKIISKLLEKYCLTHMQMKPKGK